jgi:hypothetical protein
MMSLAIRRRNWQNYQSAALSVLSSLSVSRRLKVCAASGAGIGVPGNLRRGCPSVAQATVP